MRITRKLLIPTLIFVSLIIAGLIAYNTLVSIRQDNEAEQGRLENMSEVFHARLKAKEDLAVALASDVANNPEVQAAFAAGDRERLTELTLPAYKVLDAEFDIPQFQFHLPPATSFLRLHNLEQYGDDLSSFRFTVLEANAENRVVSGPEIGRGGLGIRGVVPVSYQGRHIGTVEFGTNVDLTLIEELKNEFGYDMQILLSRGPAEVATFQGATGESQGPIDELLLQASTLGTPVFASSTNYTQALAGTASIEDVSVDKLEYAVFSTPLYDYSGNVIGVVDIISDHTMVVQQQNVQIILSIGILLVSLLVIGLGFAFFTGRTLRPIGELTSVASSIAAGDLSKKTNVKSDDELGTLAQAFDTMTTQLRELIGSLEMRVADRTKALATSAEVSRRLSTIRNQKELVIEVVERVQEAFGYYHAQIYLYGDDQEELLMVGGTGDAGAAMLADGHKVQKGRGLVGRAAETNRAMLVSDTSSDSDWLPNPLLPDTKSEAAVPISVGDKVLGVLDVQHDVVGGLAQEDVDSLSAIANQVAIAMQNIQSAEVVAKRAKELATVAEISTATATIQNTFEMLATMVHLTQRGFGLYHAHVFTYDEKTEKLQIVACGYQEGDENEGTHGTSSIPIAREQSLVARAGRTRRAVIVNDVQNEPGWLPNPLLPNTRAELAVPLIVGDKLLGVLDVQSDHTDAFTEEDANIQMTLASQVATALQNARSFENAQKESEHEAKLNAISQKIQDTATIEDAMKVAARELGHALGRRQTLVALEPAALAGDNKGVQK